jgi:hypothetical protein
VTRAELEAKLLALLKLRDRGSPGEMQAAAIAAQRLMDRWRITEEDARRSATETFERRKIYEGSRKRQAWDHMLLNGIAYANACVILRAGAPSGINTFLVVGLPSDVMMVDYLYAYLRAAVARHAKVARLRGKDARRYRDGMVVGIMEKLLAERTESSPGLVAVDQRATRVKEHLKDVKVSTPRQRLRGSQDGYAAGKALSIQRPLTAAPKQQLTLFLGAGTDA